MTTVGTPISVTIPTWRRPESLTKALNHIMECRPGPLEVLVHVDAGDSETKRLLESEYPTTVQWFCSSTTVGPGGGRNLLFRQAKAPLVACFDDDSWPLTQDYLAIASELFDQYPRVAVLTGNVVVPDAAAACGQSALRQSNSYEGGACLIRREAFLKTGGYLPLRYAYGMEEADLALQLLDAGWQLLRVPKLLVFHETSYQHHSTAAVNASHIRNIALLTYLRYPKRYWPLGLLQVLNRVRYAAGMTRWHGIIDGLWQIPWTLWQYRKERRPVRPETIAQSRKLANGRQVQANETMERR